MYESKTQHHMFILSLWKNLWSINPLSDSVASYRNQSNGLLCKSIDWFPYEGNTGTIFFLDLSSICWLDNSTI